jgi:hypothetical protein
VTSEGQNLVGSGTDFDDFGRSDPLTVHHGQGIVGRPTGNRASLSDVDGNLVVLEFPE